MSPSKSLFPQKKISRRDFIRLSGTAVSGLLLAACKPGSVSAPTLVPTEVSVNKPAVGDYYLPDDLPNSPVGIGRGIFPGRVTWVHNPAAARWDARSGYWWDNTSTRAGEVRDMLSQALGAQTGETDDSAAWDALFRHFNRTHERGDAGYQPGEKIAIKVNMNVVGDSQKYLQNGTFSTPQVVKALLLQLVQAAGVPPEMIYVYDVVRHMPDAVYDACQVPELEGVTFVDWKGGNGRQACQINHDLSIQWSYDVDGNPANLPACITEASYLINMANLKGHNLAGVTLTAKNHFGSFRSILKGQDSMQAPQGANLHGFVAAHYYSWGAEWTWEGRKMGTYNPLVDLMGHPQLGGKTLLYIIDALYAASDQMKVIDESCRWQSQPFNGSWTSSLFLSQDGVAIDSVGLDFLRSEPTILRLPDIIPPGSTPDNYLHEAAQADNPPSGTIYDPNASGTRLSSLGTHEHWNNGQEKLYSRNLGTGEGIELVSVT
jgi:hypothetical protein